MFCYSHIYWKITTEDHFTHTCVYQKQFNHKFWNQEIKIIGPLHDPVTWYGINYTGTQNTQWDFQNKGTLTSPGHLFFVLKVPLRHLRPSTIYSVPCDWILQRAYYRSLRNKTKQQSQVHFAGMTLSNSHRVFSTVFHLWTFANGLWAMSWTFAFHI